MPNYPICNSLRIALAVFLASSINAIVVPELAHAQTPPMAADIYENVIRVPVTASDLEGKHFAADIAVTTYKPAGNGPFPLVVISHGRAEDPRERAAVPRYRFQSASRFFVRKGFVVAVPTRLGYGDTVGVGDPESRGDGCEKLNSSALLQSTTAEIKAVVARMRQETYVDPQRLVLAGESVGGYATVGATSAHIPGLRAAIDFSGGDNGHPTDHPGKACRADEIRDNIVRLGKHADAPMLWLYAENDRFFGPENARYWHDAYVAAGGHADLMELPPLGDEGHNLFGLGNDMWQPLVDNFLARFGFTTRGTMRPIAPTHYARIEDIPVFPSRTPAREELYRKFLAAPLPRALAIGDKWAYALGDDAPSRALSSCQAESTMQCKLYAVDNDVVWRE